MLITNAQMRLFEHVNTQNFHGYMVAHLKKHYALNALWWSAKDIDAIISTGIVKANQYDFITRYEVCLFLNISIMLGTGFTNDPQLVWVNQYLRPMSFHTAKDRVDVLYDKTLEYLTEIQDENEPFPIIPYAELNAICGGNHTIQLSMPLHKVLKLIWLEKYKKIGDHNVEQLIATGKFRAAEMGFIRADSISFVTILIFIFGHQFYIDSNFSLFEQTIKQFRDKDDQTRLMELKKATARITDYFMVSEGD